MDRSFACATLLFVAAALGATAPAAAGGLSLDLWPVPPAYQGTTWGVGLKFSKETPNDGLVFNPPFAVRVVLPEGMTLRAPNLGNFWSCTPPPANTRILDCTYSGTLAPNAPSSMSMGINADVSPGALLGPATVVATISSAQLPLPAEPVCAAAPSTTGCATATTTISPSSLTISGWATNSGWTTPGQVSVWSGPPLEVGAPGGIAVEFRNIGYGETNTPVTLKLALPIGVTYNAVLNSIPQFACSAANTPDGQLVTCTTPYMLPSQNGFVSIGVNAGATLPVPGPVFFHSAIGNNVVAPPTTCVADPAQPGCGRLQFPTRGPRVADLQFRDQRLTHSPAWFEVGAASNTLTATFRNAGEGNAAATALTFALPVGFAFGQVIQSTPSLTCTTHGTPAVGQRVTCSGAGLPSGALGTLAMRMAVDLSAERPGPVPVLGAITDTLASAPAVLDGCVDNPSQPDCAWREIPVWATCATLQGFDTIYCTGFEEIWPALD